MSASIRRVVQKVNSQAGNTGYKVQKLTPYLPALADKWGELVSGAKWLKIDTNSPHFYLGRVGASWSTGGASWLVGRVDIGASRLLGRIDCKSPSLNGAY